MTMNDNDNILFDHNLQIEITIYNSLENQIVHKNIFMVRIHLLYFLLSTMVP